ncbi:MAG TPA: hypothetical protein DEO57_06220, partial [Phycisphaerales bacterium]|nr:hypothetical protein [Phycisphaerales bacterium]
QKGRFVIQRCSRNFKMAPGARQLMATEAPRIDCKMIGCKSGGHESHLGVVSNDGVAQQRFMFGHVHGPGRLELMPAIRTRHHLQKILSN